FGPVAWFFLGLFALAGLALGSSRLNPRHSYAIAIALVVVGVGIITSSVVLAETTGQVGCLGPCGNGGGATYISGSITVPAGSNNGTLALEVRTYGTDPLSITSITLTNTTIPSNVSGFEFIYLGKAVSVSNPLPWNYTASGSMTVANVAAGKSYDISYVVTLSNSSHEGGGIELTATN
ncbi:MAG: hypothetical protein ABSG45_08105, partial [Nitrososphaerales archaeon]